MGKMWRGFLLPWARHGGSVIVGFLLSAAVLPDLSPEDLATLQETVSMGLVMLGLIFYSFIEKALKWVTRRWMGEHQPGDLAPPSSNPNSTQ
jgi:hypothetical protein